MGKCQAEAVSVHVGQDFDAFYRQPFEVLTDTGAEEQIRVISADGKDIVMPPEGLSI
jgi:hypothetical protein